MVLVPLKYFPVLPHTLPRDFSTSKSCFGKLFKMSSNAIANLFSLCQNGFLSAMISILKIRKNRRKPNLGSKEAGSMSCFDTTLVSFQFFHITIPENTFLAFEIVLHKTFVVSKCYGD